MSAGEAAARRVGEVERESKGGVGRGDAAAGAARPRRPGDHAVRRDAPLASEEDFVSSTLGTTPLGPSTPAANTPSTTTAKDRADGLGRDAFLKLLVTQMSHQNPLQPQ